MWDNQKTVIAGIVGATLLVVAGVTFVLVYEGKKGEQTQPPSGQTDTRQSDQEPGNSFLENGISIIDTLRGNPRTTPGSQPGPGSTSGTTGQPASPTPTPSATPQPTPAPQELSVPGDPNFTAASFTVTSKNSSSDVGAYVARLDQAVSGLDLVNGFDVIAPKIQQAFESQSPQSLDSLRAQIAQKQTTIVAIPVPSRVLGLAQNYYLAYGRLSDFLGLAKQWMQSQSSVPESEIEKAQDELTHVSDVLVNDYDTAKTIAAQ